MPVSPIESAEYETIDNLTGAIGPIGTGIDIVKFIYEFGKTSPVEYAIENIRREIELIKTRLDVLSTRLDTVTQRLVKAENLARIRSLQEHTIRLSTLAFQIKENPEDRARAAEAAFEAGQRADIFLTDSDLWLWSDVVTITPRNEIGEAIGPSRIEPVGPDFKTALALPVYSMALATWIAAMMIVTQQDREAVTIAERVRSRITCDPVAASKFAQNGVCTFSVQCSNTIARTRRVLREFNVTMAPELGPTVLCTINPDVVLQDEQEEEDAYPPIMMLALWEEMLKSVRANGHLPAEQFIGVFPNWTAAFIGMYGIDRDLNMDYLTQTLPSDTGAWSRPLRVGTGWSFEQIIPGGGGAVLAKRLSGEWLWYYHDGSETNPPTDVWRGPNVIGTWNGGDPALTKWYYFGAGYGVVYGIVLADPTGQFTVGDLYWNRFEGYMSGQGGFATPQRIGNGWQGLNPVFSGSEGTIYGVRDNGVLRWYNHTGWGTGANSWAEPRDLVTNVDWQQFERIVPGGEGVIYGVLANGQMRCFRHHGWRIGDDRLEGPLSVGSRWRFYRPLFASQPRPITGVH